MKLKYNYSVRTEGEQVLRTWSVTVNHTHDSPDYVSFLSFGEHEAILIVNYLWIDQNHRWYDDACYLLQVLLDYADSVKKTVYLNFSKERWDLLEAAQFVGFNFRSLRETRILMSYNPPDAMVEG